MIELIYRSVSRHVEDLIDLLLCFRYSEKKIKVNSYIANNTGYTVINSERIQRPYLVDLNETHKSKKGRHFLLRLRKPLQHRQGKIEACTLVLELL